MEPAYSIFLVVLALAFVLGFTVLVWFLRQQILAIKVEMANDRNDARVSNNQIERYIDKRIEGVELKFAGSEVITNTLREQLTSCVGNLDKNIKEVHLLQGRMSKNTDVTKQDLAKLNDSLKKFIHVQNEALKELEGQIEPLRPLPKALESSCARIDSKVADLKEKFQPLLALPGTFADECSRIDSKVVELQEKLQPLLALPGTFADECSRIDSQVNQIEEQVRPLLPLPKKLENKYARIEGKLEELQGQIKPLLPLPGTLADECSRLGSSINKLQARLDACEDGHLAELLVKDLKDAAKARPPKSLETLSDKQGKVNPASSIRKGAPVILVAGMRHSGSTALYNIVRLGFAAMGIEILSNYSEKENIAREARKSPLPAIIKIHEMRDDVLDLATLVLTSKRDLRDTVASAVRRKFFLLEKLSQPSEYAKYNRMLHDIWAPYSDYEFNYERYRANPVEIVREVLAVLGFDINYAEEIAGQVENLPLDQYKTTLLTAEHITDPEHKLTFADTLSPVDISRIELDHYAWLARHGYITQAKET